MAKQTVKEWLAEFKNWPSAIQRNALFIFDDNAHIAMGRSRFVAPQDTGLLRNKVTQIKAKTTDKGVRAGYIFTANSDKGFYYPYWVNKGTRPNGKEINIKTDKNPNAQKGFAEAGRDFVEKRLMQNMSDLISKVFLGEAR